MTQVIARQVIRMDLILLHLIISWNVHALIKRFFYWISRSADGHLYVGYGLSLPFIFGSSGRSLFLALIFAFAAQLPVYYLLKNNIKRERPYRKIENLSNLIMPPDQYSFPSGHTAGAFIIAEIAGFHFPALQRLLIIWAVLVGISRIFLRVHYPSDVIAGMILGLGTSSLGIMILF